MNDLNLSTEQWIAEFYPDDYTRLLNPQMSINETRRLQAEQAKAQSDYEETRARLVRQFQKEEGNFRERKQRAESEIGVLDERIAQLSMTRKVKEEEEKKRIEQVLENIRISKEGEVQKIEAKLQELKILIKDAEQKYERLNK